MSPESRDNALRFFAAFAAIVTVLLAGTFWRLGHHSARVAAQWAFVWLWTIASPVYLAFQLRRATPPSGVVPSAESLDTLRNSTWQVLMAGSLAAFGVWSLVGDYI